MYTHIQLYISKLKDFMSIILWLLILKDEKDDYYYFQIFIHRALLQISICFVLLSGKSKQKKHLLYLTSPFKGQQEIKKGKEFCVVFLTADFSESKNTSFFCNKLPETQRNTCDWWVSLLAWVIIPECTVLH